MNSFIQTSAFIVAAGLPFYLIAKWRHWGLAASMLFGWGIVFLAGELFPTQERYEPLGAGLWMIGGWLIMLVWCLPIYIAVLIYHSLRKRK
jgi:hypothetical protein